VNSEEEPIVRTPWSYLRWLIRKQAGTFYLGVCWGSVWMVSLGLMPFAIGRAIDAVSREDDGAVTLWVGLILVLTAVNAAGSVLRHRCDTIGKLKASYLTIRLAVRQATRLGARLTDRVTVGEVVAIGTADISRIGSLSGAMSRGIGSLITIVIVAAVLLSSSVSLGLLVLIGAPVLLLATGPLLSPLHKRAGRYRDLQGELTRRADDIVSGLRVLRGIGGEASFGQRYRQDSQRVRHAGVQVARLESVLPAAEVVLPGILVVGVVWVGAHLAISGRITVGDLVAAYGYVAFLGIPMRMITYAMQALVGVNVAAGHVVAFLRLDRDPTAGAEPVGLSGDLTLHDGISGLTARAGLLTAVASRTGEEAAELAARCGRYADGPVTVSGVPLRKLPLEQVRELILVAGNDDALFTGELSEQLLGRPDEELTEALRTASALDIVAGLPDGLRTTVAEGGRSFSGGERQRLRLARALVADPPILIMVEPTSAVDAHTESVIAGRVRVSRTGRTTVVMTTSPLILDQADEVAYLENGMVIATGTHRELMKSSPRYAETVMRDQT
jgi:ABC-type multidrug transport system fused ATPase/permease subunit